MMSVLGEDLIFPFILPAWLCMRRVTAQMREVRRLVPKSEFMRRAMISGTVFFDHSSPGFAFIQVWWTPEDVAGFPAASHLSRLPQGEWKVSEFEEWCWENYLHPVRGKALFVPVLCLGHGACRRLERRFPGAKRIHVWSALIRGSRLSSNAAGQRS